MATVDLFDRVGSLLEEIGAEKAASTKQAMDDPGGHEGPSSHPSANADNDEEKQPAPEGAQSADNEQAVKEQTRGVVDTKPEATPENAPTQDEVQQGQGVDAAKPTGEDPSTEKDFKGTKDDPPAGSATDQGGTTHPASVDFGEKYSSATVASMSDDALYKAAADLSNEIAADIANGFFAPQPPAEAKQAAETTADSDDATGEKQAMTTKSHCPSCHKDYEGASCPDCGYSTKMAAEGEQTDANSAAAAGYQAAASVGDATDADKRAAAVLTDIIKSARDQADLIADYLQNHYDELQKASESAGDPTGGEANGEDHGTEEIPPEAAEGGGEGGGGGEDLLAAMAGGGDPAAAEGAPMEGAPMGGGGMEGGGMEGGGMAPPEALGGMGEDDALQQLAMALMELGIDPAMLAAAGDPAPKLASAVSDYKQSGKFRIEPTKSAAEREVRDYMKQYIHELCQRSR